MEVKASPNINKNQNKKQNVTNEFLMAGMFLILTDCLVLAVDALVGGCPRCCTATRE